MGADFYDMFSLEKRADWDAPEFLRMVGENPAPVGSSFSLSDWLPKADRSGVWDTWLPRIQHEQNDLLATTAAKKLWNGAAYTLDIPRLALKGVLGLTDVIKYPFSLASDAITGTGNALNSAHALAAGHAPRVTNFVDNHWGKLLGGGTLGAIGGYTMVDQAKRKAARLAALKSNGLSPRAAMRAGGALAGAGALYALFKHHQRKRFLENALGGDDAQQS